MSSQWLMKSKEKTEKDICDSFSTDQHVDVDDTSINAQTLHEASLIPTHTVEHDQLHIKASFSQEDLCLK